jgi:hypothetical protein
MQEQVQDLNEKRDSLSCQNEDMKQQIAIISKQRDNFTMTYEVNLLVNNNLKKQLTDIQSAVTSERDSLKTHNEANGLDNSNLKKHLTDMFSSIT